MSLKTKPSAESADVALRDVLRRLTFLLLSVFITLKVPRPGIVNDPCTSSSVLTEMSS